MTEGDLAGVAADHVPGQTQRGIKKIMIMRCLGKGRVMTRGYIKRRIAPIASQIHLFLFPPWMFSPEK